METRAAARATPVLSLAEAKGLIHSIEARETTWITAEDVLRRS
jgi:hypothetical protein